MGSVDLVVVGAGFGGLCAAKTYNQLAPDTNILVLEARATVGGVWAEENLYEGIKTNNLVGLYEYSDFPLQGVSKYGVPEGNHIPGRIIYEYLKDYAVHFEIFPLIHFHTDVGEIEKVDGGWRISAIKTEADGSGKQQLYECLKNQAPAVAKDPEVKTVTVVGASKIGYDAVYLFASHGKRVEWIVRESGGGAVWMAPPWIQLGPWMVMLEHVVTTRFFTWFSPCVWGHFDGFNWIRKFLHGTWLGRLLVHKLWEQQRADTIDGNGYRKERVLTHLEPRESLFWNPRVGIHNYETDIHDYIRSGQVVLHRKDINRIGRGGSIDFTDGSRMETDALVAVTGWQLAPKIRYKPEGIDADLGIPSSSYTADQEAFWADMDTKADKEILNRFPYLRHPPEAKLSFTQSVSPFRLYRGIAPPTLTKKGDHSLTFIGMVHCTATLVVVETQALWSFAYLNNQLPIDRKNVYWDTALTSRYGKHRYPWGFSAWWPEFVYDAVPYADMLMTDLGLRKWRKTNWKKEVLEGYTIHDYKGISDEWVRQQGEKT